MIIFFVFSGPNCATVPGGEGPSSLADHSYFAVPGVGLDHSYSSPGECTLLLSYHPVSVAQGNFHFILCIFKKKNLKKVFTEFY